MTNLLSESRDTVVVTGGRSYQNYTTVLKEIEKVIDEFPEVCRVVHGGAPGADSIAEIVAEKKDLDVQVYRADWERYGGSAGPIRNGQMLREEKSRTAVLLAFPGGRGTKDCINQAKTLNYTVVEIEDEDKREFGNPIEGSYNA